MMKPRKRDTEIRQGDKVAWQLSVVKLKKGLALRNCIEVCIVQQLVSTDQHEPLLKVRLVSLIINANQATSEDQKVKNGNFFMQYSNTFDINDGEQGRTIFMRHKFNTTLASNKRRNDIQKGVFGFHILSLKR